MIMISWIAEVFIIFNHWTFPDLFFDITNILCSYFSSVEVADASHLLIERYSSHRLIWQTSEQF